MHSGAEKLATRFFEIPGYTIGRLVGEGSSSRVYEATSEHGTFVVKIPNEQSQGEQDITRQLQEATLLARIKHPNIAQLIESGEAGGQVYMVFEAIQGGSLADLIAKSAPLAIEQLIPLAIDLATALDAVHRFNVIHLDLKPENVLLTPAGTPKLIDFNLARREVSEVTSKHVTVGTIAYGSPEQLGLLSRPTDQRSDLYSLGCVLYECATGRQPFNSPDPAEALRRHMNELPPSPEKFNSGIDKVLAAVILKLMAKDPDDRYQSAEGLGFDLRHLDELRLVLEKKGNLCLDADSLNYLKGAKSAFFGRASDLDKVMSAIDNAAAGIGSILVVEGESGMGKSKLVVEAMRRTGGAGLPIFGAKAQQNERVPFGIIGSAIESYLRRVQNLPDASREVVHARLAEAAGPSVPLVRKLTPHLGSILPYAGDLQELDPRAEQERYFTAVSSFICAFAKSMGGLVLLLDDVQWMDLGSLAIVERIAGQIDETRICMIATVRTDRTSESARLQFEKTCRGHAERVELHPLTRPEAEELTSHLLGGRGLDTAIKEKLLTAADGNPFAISEYLQSLLDQGAIRPTSAMWVATVSSIKDINLPSDVIQLLIDRIESLQPSSLRVACFAAVAGFEFDLGLISRATKASDWDIKRATEEMAQHNLIERQHNKYAFIHDRVQEALMKRMSDEEIRNIHQDFAETLESDAERDLYDLARHYIHGRSDANPAGAHLACLRAGIKAYQACSNEQAFAFLNEAWNFVVRYKFAVATELETGLHLAKAALMTGRNSLTLDLVARLQEIPRGREQKAEISLLASQAHASMGNYKDAWTDLCSALRYLRAAPPKTLIGNLIAFCGLLLWTSLLITTGWGKGKAGKKERERRLRISRIHTPIGYQVAYFYNPIFFAQIIVRERLNVHYIGECREYAKACVVFSFLPGILGLRKLTKYFAEQSIETARRLHDSETLAYCEAYACIGMSFAGLDEKDLLRIFVNGAEIAKNVARFCGQWEIVTSIGSCGAMHFHLGRDLAYVNQVTRYRAITHRGDGNGIITAIDTAYALSLVRLGRSEEALSILQRLRTEAHKNDSYGQTWLWGAEIVRLIESESLGAELDAAINQFMKYRFVEFHTRTFFAAVAHARLLQMRAQPPSITSKHLNRSLRWSWVLSWLMARTPLHKTVVYAIKGGYEADRGRFAAAAASLEKAYKYAQQAGSVYGLWLTARERARLAMRQMRVTEGIEHATEALKIAREEAWVHRAEQITRDFSLTPEVGSKNRYRSSHDDMTPAEVITKRTLDSLLKVAEAATTIADPIRQAEDALKALVWVLDAERGFLFLCDPEEKNLRFAAGCNSKGELLNSVSKYSSTVVNSVFASREAVVLAGDGITDISTSSSILAHDLRSIISVPVLYQEHCLGVVYLDNSLAAGVFSHQDLETLRALANHIAIALEMGRAAQAETKRQVYQKELAVTRSVQTMLLPRTQNLVSADFEFASAYLPASSSGGDWWWWEMMTNKPVLRFMIGDVSGHGAGAAMVTAIAAATLAAVRNQSIIYSAMDSLSFLNESLFNYCRLTHMMTMSIVDIDLESNQIDIHFAGAPPILIQHDADEPQMLQAAGDPLGLSAKINIGHVSCPYRANTRLMMFTDGCYELANPHGRSLNFRGLMKLHHNVTGLPCAGARDFMMGKLNDYRGGVEQPDDMTMVLVKLTYAYALRTTRPG